ncbi:hypothetical protein NDU88_003917 [Pleurodeles waltl]|uniref:Uncharacterized protein n=1 Tax=Pleurodeles waltl TaxID=8319 RepID=A0AAV7VEN3_PLEWA|nr:hypothetical protein NDU88_003917 [Pleurodeles waltl]
MGETTTQGGLRLAEDSRDRCPPQRGPHRSGARHAHQPSVPWSELMGARGTHQSYTPALMVRWARTRGFRALRNVISKMKAFSSPIQRPSSYLETVKSKPY